MKRVILICMLCACFCAGFSDFSEADDLASLKEQVKAMQDQLRSQMDIINKQNEQIGVMPREGSLILKVKAYLNSRVPRNQRKTKTRLMLSGKMG